MVEEIIWNWTLSKKTYLPGAKYTKWWAALRGIRGIRGIRGKMEAQLEVQIPYLPLLTKN